MPTIPPNNSTGLYGIDGSSVAISNDVTVDNLAATGNITAGANIAAGNNITAVNNITAGGNITADYFIGDGSLLTNIDAGNIIGGYGNGNVSVYLASGTNTANIVTTGNISGQYILGDGSQLTGLPATYGNANVNAHMAAFGSNTIATTGNITAGYFIGDGSQLTGLPATYGNAEVAAFLPTYTGNLAGGNLAIGNNANILNDLTVGGTIYGTFAGNISGNLVVPGANTDIIFNSDGNAGASSNLQFDTATDTLDVDGLITVSGNITAQGNISGNYILGNGSQLTGLPETYNDSNVTTLLASFGSNVIATTGNVTAGNITTTRITATSGTNVFFDGISVAGGSSVIGANIATQRLQANSVNSNTTITAGGTISTTGNISGANISGTGLLISAPLQTAIGASGIITYGDMNAYLGNVTGANIIGNGQYLTNLPGANVTGTVANATYATSAGSATTATSALTANTVTNATQANITSVGTLTGLTVGGDTDITGNLIVGQNLVVNGNTTSINITELNVEDPIISQGRGANNAPLTTNDGKDRGEQFWYYTSEEKSAFSGYDNSAGKMLLATDVSIANEIVTVNSLGNIVGGNIEATSVVTSGNVTGSYVVGNGSLLSSISGANVSGQVANALVAGTVYTAAQPAITSVGTLTSLSVTGNTATGGINTDNYRYANGTPVSFAGTYGDSNVTTLLAAFGSNTITTTGNIDGGNVTATAIVANTVTGGNVDAADFNGGNLNNMTLGTQLLTNGQRIAGGAFDYSQLYVGFDGGDQGIALNSFGNAPVQINTGNGGANTYNWTFSNSTGEFSAPGNITTTGNIIGNGQYLTNLTGANVTGTVASATQANTANVANSVSGGNVSGQVANALVAGTVYTAAQPAITSVGTLTSLSVSGNVVPGGINTDNYRYANGTPVSFAGTYGNANVSNYLASGTNTANIVTTGNIQGNVLKTTGSSGNITGVDYIYANTVIANATVQSTGRITAGAVTYANTDGTAGQVLTTYGNGLTYFSTVSSGSYGDANVNTLLAAWGSNTLSTTGNVTAGNFIGNGSALTTLTGANVTGSVAQATVANTANAVAGANVTGTVANATFATSAATATSATTAGTVTTNAQPNITSVGTLSSLSVTGNIATGGILTDGYYYANGTPVSFGGGSYGDSNVNTLLASWGSNTLNTTGNVTVGNLNMTGQVFDASGVLQLNAVGNIVLAPTGSAQIFGATDIIGGKLTTGAVTYANVDGTNGQVLTTYGNGVTYFSTVSGGGSPGGSDGQIQYNDGGAFGGNVAMTFDDATGNVTLGNIVVELDQQIQTVAAYSGNSSVRNPGQITIGNGYDGNITNTTYLTVSARGARALSYDKYVKVDNGQRNAQLAALSYVDLNGGNLTTGTSRVIGVNSEVTVINGNTASGPQQVRGTQSFISAGQSANTGNANISGCQVGYTFAQTFNGSSMGNVWMNMAETGGGGDLAPLNTYIGYGILPRHAANVTTGNVFGVYLPSTTTTYGSGTSDSARRANRYYFLRCDDDVAQTKLGSLRLFHEYRYNNSSSSGTLTVNADLAQVQYIDVTEDISTVTFSSFVVSASDSVNTDYQMDTVTLVFRQDSTGHTITMPTGTAYKYAGGVNVMGTTANAVQMVSVSAIYNATTAATEYLITISPEFS